MKKSEGKDLKKIKVTTLPNGYALDVEGQKGGWLYANKDELVKGMIFHIGLDIMKNAEKSLLDDILAAMVSWPNADEAVIKVKDFQKANLQLESTLKNQTELIKKLRRRNAELESVITSLRKEIHPDKVDYSSTSVDVKPKTIKAAPIKTTLSEKVYHTLATPITMEKTGFSRRTIGVLKYVGGKENHTIGDIARLRRSEFRKARGAGAMVMGEIEKYFIEHGLEFGMDVDAVLWVYKKQQEE